MVIVIVLGVIAAFSIAAILFDPNEDNHSPRDPRTDLPIWAFRGRR
jgi:hypothetical protein